MKNLEIDWNEYILWDMCAGVGNLQESLDFIPRQSIYLSTLDYIDVDTLQKKKDENGNYVFYKDNCFQYDYLNDDIVDNKIIYKEIKNDKGEITKIRKLPLELENAIKNKKVLVFINPPYVEGSEKNSDIKAGVGHTKIEKIANDYGKAVRELTIQFLIRIQKELPNCIIAMFSKLKHINGRNFVTFRELWQPKYLDGFIMSSKNFNLSGEFPIGFLIWDTSKKKEHKEIKVDILNNETKKTGTKIYYSFKDGQYINDWIKRVKIDTTESIPLSNALTLSKSKSSIDKTSKDSLGYLSGTAGCDFQQNNIVFITSGTYINKLGVNITKENLSQSCIFNAVRRAISHSWILDRDQFLKPHTEPDEDFTNDCIVMTLFSASNLSASGDLKYKIDKKHPDGMWHLTNHWIPFSQEQLGRIKLESTFMSDFIKDKNFSKEAQDVLDEGLRIWRFYLQNYHNFTNTKQGDIDLQLNDNAGWYQIRMALQNNGYEDELRTLKELQLILNDKIVSGVYKFGFLLE
ncbi:MAG: hypothetical protein Ta2D_08720 [Rickettsiales bacterium]|nr:MAG: hypothetical protein Ta2D_08720 [Rickettsiales bacterium]